MLKTTTVRLDQDLDKKLAEYAKQEDLSKNQVVKRAIRKLVEQEGKDEPKKTG